MTAHPESTQFGGTSRPEMYRFHNGEKAPLAFDVAEYEARTAGLRRIMSDAGVDAAVFTSMHNIAYYSGLSLLRLWPPLRPCCHRR